MGSSLAARLLLRRVVLVQGHHHLLGFDLRPSLHQVAYYLVDGLGHSLAGFC